jgi:hypothetical protein
VVTSLVFTMKIVIGLEDAGQFPTEASVVKGGRSRHKIDDDCGRSVTPKAIIALLAFGTK